MFLIPNATGHQLKDGKLIIRIDCVPEPENVLLHKPADLTYAIQHLYLPVVTTPYPGKMAGDGPADMKDFQAWLSSQPHAWRTNPSLIHFLTIDPTDLSLASITDQIQSKFPKADISILDELLANPLANKRDIGLLMLPKQIIPSRTATALDLATLAALSGLITLLKDGLPSDPAIDAVINIGHNPAGTAGSTGGSAYTRVILDGTADGTGTLDALNFYFGVGDALTVYDGVFYNTGTDKYKCRNATDNLGTIVFGSLQTVTGKSLAVTVGDVLGSYNGGTGNFYRDTSGGAGVEYIAGNKCVLDNETTYTLQAGYHGTSIHATGATAGWANIKNIRMGTGSILATDIAKIRMGTGSIAVADIAKFGGVAV